MPASFMENYKAKHQHPLNRLTHNIGIPLIVISLVVFFFNWRWALAMFVVGWILQFVGHWIEGNQPAFFRNPVYLIIGPLWLVRRALGAIGLGGSRASGEKTLTRRAP
ncbi:MAG TPA: DUF962 domain-containing protein [Pyrinomonadaceae bacterium]